MLYKACIILVIASIPKAQSTSFTPFCVGDVCYIRAESSSGRNWTEAQQACQRFRSTLPVVDDPTHQQSFEAAARCLTADEERKSGLWIGAKASVSQPQNWTWLDGSNYTEIEVESQEGYGKNYAFVQTKSNEVRAHASYPTLSCSYICHYPTSADLCTNGTGFTFENRCFVTFHKPVSWFSARNACLARDGDLASFSNISLSLLEGKIGSDAFWVGLRSSQWNWQRAADSSSDSDVTFTLWNSGEPNDNASSCISTDEGDKFPNWRDYNCSESLPFICQYTASSPLNQNLAICHAPYTAIPAHTDAASASLRSSTTGKKGATIPSGSSAKTLVSSTTPVISSTIPSVSSNEDIQNNGTGSVDDVALGVGLGVGIGVPVIIALVVGIVVCVRRKRRNSNAGGNSKSRKTVTSGNSQTTQENDRMEMSETQNGHPHYDNFSAQYATIPAAAAAGPKSDAPSTQGTVYADLSFNQAGHS